ncbi:putative lipase, alpha/beta hydrolase family [Nocardia nova SH22a]|uniref:Putative lipase, alpha/beta hydrolase family n=1 Tax=Nocardia nova SH22a TaxID=1415166 RepID=W5T6Q8_9NOCA|nr:alpha/beta fold hydrolase [Nocardia nova]AHH15005.1 putative lipase, alpha/beta hydrolase family [Nocardia nova SH22a]
MKYRSTENSSIRRVGVLAAAAALLGALHAGFATAHADPTPPQPYPVPEQFLIDAIHGALQGGAASPPGTNDWSCKPSAAHPEPVVLIHGFLANRTDNWQTYGPLLANNGYCVFALTYGSPDGNPDALLGGLTSMQSSAATLDAFVDRVRQATGADKVDLVGHSEGATMPYWYIKLGGGAAKVGKMIGLAPAVHGLGGQAATGTGISTGSANGPAAFQFLGTSDFVRQLAEGGITVPGVTYTQIVTRYDDVVIPYTTGIIDEPGSTNYVVQNLCPQDYADHLSINSDPATARLVLNALDPDHPQPVECTLVLPAIGVPPGPGR